MGVPDLLTIRTQNIQFEEGKYGNLETQHC